FSRLLPSFFYCCTRRRHLHSFPTRRSSDLPFPWLPLPRPALKAPLQAQTDPLGPELAVLKVELRPGHADQRARSGDAGDLGTIQDRKSTRLNSSHISISYAVFCLKKKKK